MAKLGLNAVSVLNLAPLWQLSGDFCRLSTVYTLWLDEGDQHSGLVAGTQNKQPRSWNTGLVCLPLSSSLPPSFFFFVGGGEIGSHSVSQAGLNLITPLLHQSLSPGIISGRQCAGLPLYLILPRQVAIHTLPQFPHLYKLCGNSIFLIRVSGVVSQC